MSRQRDQVVSVEILADFEAFTFRLARELAVEGINGPAMFVRAMEAMEWTPKPLGLHVSREQVTRALTSSMTRRDATSRNTARGRAK